MHYIIVHYLQQWVNLNFDRSHLFKISTSGFSKGKYETSNPRPVWHISWRVCSMLGLIFSLMHQSSLSLFLSQHPVTEGIPFSLLQLNFISLLLFLLKTLSEWERLNSDNPQLSTHLSIHSFINLLPVFFFPVHQAALGFSAYAVHSFIHVKTS